MWHSYMYKKRKTQKGTKIEKSIICMMSKVSSKNSKSGDKILNFLWIIYVNAGKNKGNGRKKLGFADCNCIKDWSVLLVKVR